MEIRLIEEGDFQGVMALENATWTLDNAPRVNPFLTLEDFIESLWNRKVIVAIEDDGTVLGFLEFSKKKDRPYTYFIGIGVAENVQGRGVGRMMMNHLFDYAKANEIRKISLHVMCTNPGAIQFYERLGFVTEGTLKDEFFLNGQFVDDHLMAYFLE
jgi:ribosomal protein S18 acetylase RimI-like enzyme